MAKRKKVADPDYIPFVQIACTGNVNGQVHLFALGANGRVYMFGGESWVSVTHKIAG